MKTFNFSHVFNSLQNHVLIIDTDLKLVAVTEGIVKSSGLKREELIGKNVLDVFTQGGPKPSKFPVSVKTALEEKVLHEMGLVEWTNIAEEHTYWSARTYPVLDAEENVLYLVHESFEVTNEIKKEKILNAVENELLKQTTLTDILDRQSDGFFVINHEDQFTYVNKFMIDFGLLLNTSNLLGRKVKEVFTSPDTDKFLKRYHRIRETGFADHFIEIIDGRYLSVDAYPTLEGGVAVFFRDVTTRVETEREVLDSRKKLEMITDQIPAFVAYFDSEGRYQFANKAYEDWFEKSSKEIIGKKRSEFATTTSTELAKESEARALKGETIKYQNILHKNDKTMYVDVSYVPDIDKNTGTVRGAVVIGYEVTEQVLAKLEMEKALKLREDFMSIASHELKTPITSMYLQNQILKRHIKKDDIQKTEVEKFLKSSDGNIKRLNRLIDDMLDVTRIDNGKLALQTKKFDLVTLVEEIIERYIVQFKHIELKSSGPILGEWDRDRIDQVISNLISNSIKYGEQSPITVIVTATTKNAVITVKDSGPGIAKENHVRIFQRFERESGDISASGLGLGLYICKEIVERHHGAIMLESERGQGAQFKVILPLS